MILKLKRLTDNGKSTIGQLEVEDFKCYTIEDTNRDMNHDGKIDEKVWGQTRIPAGTYEIKLRTEGEFHEKYKRKFHFHRGMLHLQDVPDFKYILIHIGNTAEDSAGCILVGMSKANEDRICDSTVAYTRLYAVVMTAFDDGEQVFIEIRDNE